jgi:AGCS family alanine or glycine:cation symporter
MRWLVSVAFAVTAGVVPVRANADGLDVAINGAMEPVAAALSKVVFVSVPLLGTAVPLVVLWLVVAAVFFTVYFNFLNLRGFRHALRVVRGDYSNPKDKGEVSHFQALSTAVSGTVGIGNIGGVAIAISLGGPGATFWMILAGFLGMSTKFVECTLSTMYRRTNPDQSVSGGPMYYLQQGFAERGLHRFGKFFGSFYAVGIVIGCMGIGNMFQSNQAFAQIVNVTGGTQNSWFADKGWFVGLVLALLVALVVMGGIKTIARVTSRVVPFMAVFYCAGALLIIGMNYEALPFAVDAIFSGAFSPSGVAGGAVGVMVIGFQRAVFSNEAGIGSAAIAHSAARTNDPAAEGYVALLEPFIDTVVICTLTALVIITTLYYVPNIADGLSGIEMTSAAFERNVSGSRYFIALAGSLFAYSTMIAWCYYGLKGWTYLVGEGRMVDLGFKAVFCLFTVVGASIQLSAVLDFSDALVFLICIPNVIGLYLLAPVAKRELSRYQAKWQVSPKTTIGAANDGLDV